MASLLHRVKGAIGRALARQYMMNASRSDYKGTWERLGSTTTSAKFYVAGHDDESALMASAMNTLVVLERLVGVRSTDVFLEIGCGVGRVGSVLADRVTKWIGCDISSGMLKVARERLASKTNVDLVELDGVSLAKIPDNSVDVVYCTVVFMHLYEWDRYRYVQEAMRVLKPGGRCYFDNVDIASSHGWKVFMESSSYPIERRPPFMSMVSSRDELLTYGQKAGFESVAVHQWDDAWVAVTGVKKP
jgi:ubiquinone/menaquinone biosynthesis C-methylase UbiE